MVEAATISRRRRRRGPEVEEVEAAAAEEVFEGTASPEALARVAPGRHQGTLNGILHSSKVARQRFAILEDPTERIMVMEIVVVIIIIIQHGPP